MNYLLNEQIVLLELAITSKKSGSRKKHKFVMKRADEQGIKYIKKSKLTKILDKSLHDYADADLTPYEADDLDRAVVQYMCYDQQCRGVVIDANMHGFLHHDLLVVQAEFDGENFEATISNAYGDLAYVSVLDNVLKISSTPYVSINERIGVEQRCVQRLLEHIMPVFDATNTVD